MSFPDVPEALTGAETREEALALAVDALVVALGAYVRAQDDIPVPSRHSGQHEVVSVPAQTAARLARYTAMRRRGLSRRALAESEDVRGADMRRLLDLDLPAGSPHRVP